MDFCENIGTKRFQLDGFNSCFGEMEGNNYWCEEAPRGIVACYHEVREKYTL